MHSSTMITSSIIRNRLMVTASAVALAVSAFGCTSAIAADTDNEPPIWIELGWQVDSIEHFAGNPDLPLGPIVPRGGLTAPLAMKLDPSHSDTGEDRITYSPDGGDWLFSASIRFGRSARAGKLNQSLAPIPSTFTTFHSSLPYPYSSIHTTRPAHVKASREKLTGDTNDSETHLILDFQVGKDVGLGLFGRGSTSTLSAGVRFAHFTSSRAVSNFQETHGIHFATAHQTYQIPVYFAGATHVIDWHHTWTRQLWTTLTASGGTAQKFIGLGPSIQWQASAPLWNDPEGGSVSFDWGANVALLFGKQTKKNHHQSSSIEHCYAQYYCQGYQANVSGASVKTARNVTVPNFGGFAGFSLNYHDIKVSLGYRADLFVNAIDVGFATRKSSNMLLHGPFANVSVGLGD